MTAPGQDEPFFRVQPVAAKALVDRGIQIVDVREPQEYAEARIPGSTLIPLGTLLKGPRDLLKDGPVLFVCSEGIRSAVACEAAAAIGLAEVYNLEEGMQGWAREGYSVESGAGATPERVATPAVPPRPGIDFLLSGERLIRVHRFRYQRAVACALGTLDLTVEETLGDVPDPSKRCLARPEHPERVARPDLTIFAEGVEGAVKALIEKLRGRRPADIFLPTE